MNIKINRDQFMLAYFEYCAGIEWLTDKQRDLMKYICDGAYGDDEITLRSVSENVGIAITAIMHVVSGLIDGGWLRKEMQSDGRVRLFPLKNPAGGLFMPPDKFSSYVDMQS